MDIRNTATVIPSGERELVTLVVLRRVLSYYKKKKTASNQRLGLLSFGKKKKNKINVFLLLNKQYEFRKNFYGRTFMEERLWEEEKNSGKR